ncbi:bacteriocin-processing peptidase [Stanieria cyanosphaera PCC 7437]|uniref:Bacteriocin-processing peptidase n=1 Tax=Stanieria cyanosphaera (strain ATCC 29371 / PCC 7437) TaxID=111780 RepID=K9XUJ7_STAC7|nr:peptidase domain-containing ABC transporter [Stanieria cyanosphaera]AFZ35751.1 bacteriocin-processing peptidase [Stanieria cyanosphaera PCC 7437]
MNLELLSESSSQDHLEQQLAQILGVTLSSSELKQCQKAIQIIEPTPGKLFWNSMKSPSGVFLVIKGKIRLLDSNDNLLISLGVGTTFGELTLFTNEFFQSYTVRASFQLQLAYLNEQFLRTLIQKNPQVEQHLYRQALHLDLLLLCRQTYPLKNASLVQLKQIIPLLEFHQLQPGKLADDSLLKQAFWLVRKGELINSAGQKLPSRSFYVPVPKNQTISWRIEQPTELYTLSHANLNVAQLSLPERVEGTTANSNLIKRESNASSLSKTSIVDLPPKFTSSSSSRRKRKPYFPSPTERVGHFWQRLLRRYPFYAQQSSSDCGAACLVMIGRYWNKRFSLNRIRELARVNRSGSSLKGLCTAGETIGFTTRPVKATFSQLAQQKLPAIAHWQSNHYIVVYEVRRKYVIVGDPAIGQRTLTPEEFQADWTGYALLLEPTVLLKETQESATAFWQFWELVKPHKLVLLEVFVASLLIQLFALVTPLLTQLLLDRVIVQRSSLTLMAVGIGLLIFGLFRVAMTGLRQYFLDHTAQRVDLALIVGFIGHTFRLPLSFFESRYVGDIIARVQENHKIQRFLTGEALSIFLDLLTVFVYVGLMFWYSWQMALLALTIIPPFLGLALIATPFLQKVSREIFTALAKESSYLIEALTGVPTIKSMAVEQRVRWHWEELLNRSIKTTFSGQLISNQLQIFSSTIEVITTTAILWFGAWQVIQNQLTIGQLVAFNMLLGNVITPFQRLTVLWNQLQEVIISIERINDVLDAEPEEDLQNQPRQILTSLKGQISFQNVTFRYHADQENNVIENLSFEVQPGQTIALVGRSGSGKTTISKLILGLYLPTEGKILIDGQDITILSLRSLREQIGVVDQSNFLFGGTIRENISISHPDASLAEVQQAAIQAGAEEFIEKLPLAYETPIGERGGMLSGGQRQRLAIARALLGNPRLLILDEATSNLDAESERIIQNNLNTILQGRTTIIIAHRLSTIRQANVILVLDRGVLVESGTHSQLMAKRGHYFYLNQQQLAVTSDQ